MSYPTPPPNPNEQGGYGAPPPPNPYQQAYRPAEYSNWGKRVGATLIDTLISMVLMIPYYIGYFQVVNDAVSQTDLATEPTATPQFNFTGTSLVLMLIGGLLGIAFFVWNTCLKQGRTGYTIGKGVMGIKLISEQSGQPIGAGMSFVRALLHIVDSLPCYLGYLWPLWDPKRQTFADKILSTVVIDEPKG